jgi:hypothetical protein
MSLVTLAGRKEVDGGEWKSVKDLLFTGTRGEVGFEGKRKKIRTFINPRNAYHGPRLSFCPNRLLGSLITGLFSLTEQISTLRMEAAFSSEILVSAYGAKTVSKPSAHNLE